LLKLLQVLTKNLIIVIPASMAAGFGFGYFQDPSSIKSLIPAFTFVMVFPMMVTLQYKKAFTKCSYFTQGTAQFINFIIVPLMGYGLGRLFFADQPYMALGILLAALIPTSGMTVSWTGFAKGNVEVAVKMMIFGLSAGALLTPFYVKFLLGASVDVDVMMVLKKVLVVVFLPMTAGFITRQILLKRYSPKEFMERVRSVFPPLSTIGVIGMVFTAIALRANAIAAKPLVLLQVLVPVTLFYVALLVIGIAVGRVSLPRADAVALLYGTSLRNLSISLAIAVNAFGKAGADAALVLAAAFIVQTQVATWSTKFVDRLFGKPLEATS
jgi:ACR3 family arsenite efflux pump ArsB